MLKYLLIYYKKVTLVYIIKMENNMTQQETKKMIKTFTLHKNRLHILQNCMHSPKYNHNTTISTDLHNALLLTNIIETCLSLLSEEERFVTDLHLIQNYKWDDIEILFENRWGKANGRSERTLKRMQENALKKITAFINEANIEQYITTEKTV